MYKRFTLSLMLITSVIILSFSASTAQATGEIHIDYLIDRFVHSPIPKISELLLHRSDHQDFKIQAAQRLISEDYLKLTDDEKRYNAYNLLYKIGLTVTDSIIKTTIVDYLVESATDPSRRIALGIPSNLQYFDTKYFSEKAKKKILSYSDNPEYVSYALLKLIGQLELKEGVPILEKYTAESSERYRHDSPSPRKSIQWAAHLSSARLGNDRSLKSIIDYVKERQEWGYRNGLLNFGEDLCFTHQKAAIEIVVDYLMSNEKLPPVGQCYREPVAFPAISFLTKVIKGFPIEFSRGGFYCREDVRIAREWMKAHPDYEFK
ncbi:MAG: hypothetical protein MI974_30175 [Chitinophagales bacterium]|nr:hypothetical protein [Chitinophagales bacterium]